MSDKFAKRQQGRKCLIDMSKEKAASLSAMEYVKNGRQGDYLACNRYGTPQHIGTAVDINGHDILKRVYSPDGKNHQQLILVEGEIESLKSFVVHIVVDTTRMVQSVSV